MSCPLESVGLHKAQKDPASAREATSSFEGGAAEGGRSLGRGRAEVGPLGPRGAGDLQGHPVGPVGRGLRQRAAVAPGPEAGGHGVRDALEEGLVHGAQGAAARRLPGRRGLHGPVLPGGLPLRRQPERGMEPGRPPKEGRGRWRVEGPQPGGERHGVAPAVCLEIKINKGGCLVVAVAAVCVEGFAATAWPVDRLQGVSTRVSAGKSMKMALRTYSNHGF
jgi:hypothetical protein